MRATSNQMKSSNQQISALLSPSGQVHEKQNYNNQGDNLLIYNEELNSQVDWSSQHIGSV